MSNGKWLYLNIVQLLIDKKKPPKKVKNSKFTHKPLTPNI